jgi:tetratricopeptide (TPR) repeat protein
VLLPCLALIACEGILRLAGVGHSTSFLVRREIHGRSVWVDNAWFGLSYFPAALARSPNPVVLPVAKPAGVFRIFLFGESAALGDPRPAYGVGRYLEILLRERFPGNEFEVVCVAMTAINSHAVLPIARECARKQGDLWIVYMGNNEFMGPFGANTVFGPAAPPAGLVRAGLAFQRTRVGQVLMTLTRRVSRARSAPESWGGLKMFLDQQIPPEDPRRARVYGNFQRNLEDIVGLGRRVGVPIILSTVAGNLKDCAPFGSVPGPVAGSASYADWSRLYQAGEADTAQADWAGAWTNYEAAARLTPSHAGLHFKLGQCALALNRFEVARDEFTRSRDLDTLPFRADSRLNAIIAATARRWAGQGVSLLDAGEALASLSASGIPGEEAFHEHVHLNFEGNYQLARTFAGMIEARLPASVTNRATATWASPAVCARDLGLTDWNRQTVLQEIGRRLSDPPFVTQANQADRMRRLGARLAACAGRLQPAAAVEARAVYEDALRRRPQDHWLHHNYSEFLVGVGDLEQAAHQMQVVRDLLPYHHAAYFQLGRLFARQKQFAAARESLEAALRLRPDVAEIHLELGQVAASQGKWDEALTCLAAARRAHADGGRIAMLTAKVLEQQGKRSAAIQSLREAVRLQPESWEARELLGIELGLDGKYSEAGEQFEAVVRLRPDYAEGHLNLGIALGRQQRLAEAREQLGVALRLDPQNQRARALIDQLGSAQSREPAP